MEIRIDDTIYEISDFAHKHPGGNVIMYASGYTDSAGVPDATEVFHEFHDRSGRVQKYLNALPQRKAEGKRDQLLVAYQQWRKQLEKDGFFNPDPMHVAWRLTELALIFALGLVCYRFGGVSGVLMGVIVHGLFGGRCGWVQHEGGHNSLTGNIKFDKFLQKLTIGFGLATCGSMWNSMHEKHHATPQKIGFDLDLDTTPLVAFFKTAVEDNRPRGFSRLWSRFQHLTFLPVTSGIFVMMFWILYLHPRRVVRDKDWVQAVFLVSAHTIRPYLIHLASGLSFGWCYLLMWASMWVSGIYLFGHFSTSHTHTAVVDRHEKKDWVRFALEHTVDIEPGNPFVSWIMGFLNCQVLHHLFPNMPQFRQPEASKRLVKFCKDNGLEYEIISYREAWRRTFQNLLDVGLHYYEHGLDKERAKLPQEDVGTTLKKMRKSRNSAELGG